MYKIYKSSANGKIEEQLEISKECWVNMIDPTDEEIELVKNYFNLDEDFLRAALDEEEIPRFEVDDETDTKLILVASPVAQIERDHRIYDTLPLAIIYTNNCIITVASYENIVLKAFITGSVKSFFTFKKSRFILQILNRNATLYLTYLRQIDKQSGIIESELHKSMKNKELIQLLDLEKSLVYFSTSLKSNEIVLKKLLKMDFIGKYPEDVDLLEDVLIENDQASEMAKIYSDILSGTMDAFASVISNNLNIVMKLLTSITIVMAIPTMISSFFGMNVMGIPLSNSPFGFSLIVIFAIGLCVLATIFMSKKKMF